MAREFVATHISANVEAQFGFHHRDVLDDPRFWASRIHPDDAPRGFTEMGQLFEQDHRARECRCRIPDESWRWVFDRLVLIRDAGGDPTAMVGSSTGITDRRAHEGILDREQQEEEGA